MGTIGGRAPPLRGPHRRNGRAESRAVHHASAIIAWAVVVLGVIPVIGKSVFAIGRLFRR